MFQNTSDITSVRWCRNAATSTSSLLQKQLPSFFWQSTFVDCTCLVNYEQWSVIIHKFSDQHSEQDHHSLQKTDPSLEHSYQCLPSVIFWPYFTHNSQLAWFIHRIHHNTLCRVKKKNTRWPVIWRFARQWHYPAYAILTNINSVYFANSAFTFITSARHEEQMIVLPNEPFPHAHYNFNWINIKCYSGLPTVPHSTLGYAH
jgi:hypothetical protein